MTTYILILFMSIGIMSEKDSMALTNVPGFMSKAHCEAAGKTAVSEFEAGTKRARFVCVAQPGRA